jgi:streptomycin 6-kinase
MLYPRHFVQTTTEVFGEPGRLWLGKLPHILPTLAAQWELVLGEPFPHLSYNLVLTAWSWQYHAPVVLKIGFPRDELRREMAALQKTNGRGQVRLLASDAGECALLLERLTPGHSLWERGLREDERATQLAAQTMGQLWLPVAPSEPFLSVRQWGKGFGRLRARFGGGVGPFPSHLVSRAELLWQELQDTAVAPDVLIHGDLHHGNILAQGSNWVAIDPKGMKGEPAYEVGAWLRNPSPALFSQPDFAERLARRVAIFTEVLGLERERVVGYGLVQAVLSGWWHYEDHGRGWQGDLRVAEVLSQLPH